MNDPADDASDNQRADVVLPATATVADSAAVAALLLGGGKPIIWTAGVVAVVVGLSTMWKRWGQPLGRSTALVVVLALVGAGTLGYSMALEQQPAGKPDVPVGQSRDPRSPSSVPTSPVVSALPTTSSVATKGVPQTAPRILYSGSTWVPATTNDKELDLESGLQLTAKDGEIDFRMTRSSMNAVNTAQFSVYAATGSDPTYEECAGLPPSKWKTSLSLDELKNSKVYCVRTNEGNFAFIVIQDVSLYRPTEINDIELRWTVWQAATS